MFKDLIAKLALKALQQALCQFFGYCIEHEECPDGVCDEVVVALQSFDDATPKAELATSGAVTAPAAFNPDFSKLQPLVAAVMEVIACFKDFLGLEPRVGNAE